MKTIFGILIAIYLLLQAAPVVSQITLDGSLNGIETELSGPKYMISETVGKTVGSNLFHSFGLFNLSTGETATFTGSEGIQNIISRVTGGQPSIIDGKIISTIEGADMYFLNPAGWVFNPNASLDVKGSFHVSTCDYLRMGKDERFNAFIEDASFSSAPPEAFGFLGNNLGKITFEGKGEIDPKNDAYDGISVNAGKTLSVVAGSIELKNGSYHTEIDSKNKDYNYILKMLSAPEGRIDLVSVASQGEVVPTAAGLDVSSFKTLGDITLSGKSRISTDGNGGGDIFIRAGNFVMDDSLISSFTETDQDGGVVDIQTESLECLTGSKIVGDTLGTGDGTDITIEVRGDFLFDTAHREGIKKSKISSDSYYEAESGGNGGDIYIMAQNIDFLNGSLISSTTYGQGNCGKITLKADQTIHFDTTNEEFDASSIVGRADNSKIEGGGSAGDIHLESTDIRFENGGTISSSNYGTGDGGKITLKARDSVIFQGKDFTKSAGAIYSRTSPGKNRGNGGIIEINASEISFKDGSQISTTSYGSGKGGDVILSAESVSFTGEGPDTSLNKIKATAIILETKDNTIDGADAGKLEINANTILFENGAQISTVTDGKGKAGDVTLNIKDQIVFSGEGTESFSGINAYVGEKSQGGTGGNVVIKANEINLFNGAKIVTSAIGNGEGGEISIEKSGLLRMDGVSSNGNSSSIKSESKPVETVSETGNGGNIFITIDELILEDGAHISSSTIADSGKKSGRAGNVTIIVNENARFIGTNPNGTDSDTPKNSGAYAISKGEGAGDAGNICMTVGSLSLEEGARFSTSTSGNSLGGNVTVRTDDVLNISDSGIFASSDITDSDGGDAGNIIIHSPGLVMAPGQISTSTLGGGHAGMINIDSQQILMEKESSVSSATRLSGNAGIITIGSEALQLNNSMINTSTSGTGNAGDIQINVSNLQLDQKASVISESTSSGNAGSITICDETIASRSIVLENGSSISTSGKGNGKGGNITLTSEAIKLDQGSFITSTGNDGGGGFITIHKSSDDDNSTRVQLENHSQISTSSFGTGKGGNIYMNLSQLILNDESAVSSASISSGDAGEIYVLADTMRLNENSSISTEATQAGGGYIEIESQDITISKSKITTSVQSGEGNGGDIQLVAGDALLLSGDIIAKAYMGNGGDIVIRADLFFQSLDSLVSASSELGIDGSVEIVSPESDVQSGLTVLPQNFMDAGKWLRTPCAERTGENVSQFVYRDFYAQSTSFRDLCQPPLLVDFQEDEAVEGKASSLTNYRNLYEFIKENEPDAQHEDEKG